MIPQAHTLQVRWIWHAVGHVFVFAFAGPFLGVFIWSRLLARFSPDYMLGHLAVDNVVYASVIAAGGVAIGWPIWLSVLLISYGVIVANIRLWYSQPILTRLGVTMMFVMASGIWGIAQSRMTYFFLLIIDGAIVGIVMSEVYVRHLQWTIRETMEVKEDTQNHA